MLNMMFNMLAFTFLLAGLILIICLTVGGVLIFRQWLKEWRKENEID